MKRQITDQQYIEAARRQYHKGGKIEIDDQIGTEMVSKAPGNPDGGAYVQAWVWVYDEDAVLDPQTKNKDAVLQ